MSWGLIAQIQKHVPYTPYQAIPEEHQLTPKWREQTVQPPTPFTNRQAGKGEEGETLTETNVLGRYSRLV